MVRLRCVLLLAALAVAPAGGWAAETLPVPEAGIMGDVPGGQEQPDPGLDYKIVFDVHVLGDAGSGVDPALQAMGKLVNTFRHHGVPASHLHMVAMFHGPAILMVTNDQHLRAADGRLGQSERYDPAASEGCGRGSGGLRTVGAGAALRTGIVAAVRASEFLGGGDVHQPGDAGVCAGDGVSARDMRTTVRVSPLGSSASSRWPSR